MIVTLARGAPREASRSPRRSTRRSTGAERPPPPHELLNVLRARPPTRCSAAATRGSSRSPRRRHPAPVRALRPWKRYGMRSHGGARNAVGDLSPPPHPNKQVTPAGTFPTARGRFAAGQVIPGLGTTRSRRLARRRQRRRIPGLLGLVSSARARRTLPPPMHVPDVSTLPARACRHDVLIQVARATRAVAWGPHRDRAHLATRPERAPDIVTAPPITSPTSITRGRTPKRERRDRRDVDGLVRHLTSLGQHLEAQPVEAGGQAEVAPAALCGLTSRTGRIVDGHRISHEFGERARRNEASRRLQETTPVMKS